MSDFGPTTEGREIVDRLTKNVTGRTIVITGASNGGLGASVAVHLARASPAQICLLARSETKVQEVVDAIRSIDESIVVFFVPIELDKAQSVTLAAAQINDKVSKVDILINCAGVMAIPYSVNDKGVEMQLATNHVGHFLLTKHLWPKLLVAEHDARIVNVSSDGYLISPVHFDDIAFEDGRTYDPWTGYGQSKTANILFTTALAKKLAESHITSVACHPGIITTTSLANHLDFAEELEQLTAATRRNTGRDFVPGSPKSMSQGAATILRAAIDPTVTSGAMLFDCQPHEIADYANSDENAEKLWKWTEQVIGEKFEISNSG